MFPITLTLTLKNQDELLAAAKFFSTTPIDTPLPTIEKDAAVPVEKPSGAETARSPRTAEAGPSRPAPSDAAPAKETPATHPAADASSAPAAEAFKYETLQKKVFELLPTHGQALLKISKKHGADKFKELPADKWEAAYNDLVATYEAA